MATTYTVQATSVNAAASYSRKEYAEREATSRAKALGYTEDVVVLTGTGKEVFRVEAKPAPAPKAPRVQREALAPAALPGWEVLYDKPRAGYQILRATGGTGWALYCTVHGDIVEVSTMAEARRLVKEGTWCSVHLHAAKAAMAEAVLAA